MMPEIPTIGRPEVYYAQKVREAEAAGDTHAREASKVALYVTLGNDPHISWEEKLKYYRHALKRHCDPPPMPDEEVWAFYQSLAELVRLHAGQEALRIASAQDDLWAARVAMGQPKEEIENEAEEFFAKIITSDQCPDWFSEQDWSQLKLIRDQWI